MIHPMRSLGIVISAVEAGPDARGEAVFDAGGPPDDGTGATGAEMTADGGTDATAAAADARCDGVLPPTPADVIPAAADAC